MPKFVFDVSNYQLNLNEHLNLSKDKQVVLTMWHIETFEGGNNSRLKFLQKTAVKFNKKFPNYFLTIKTLSEEQLRLNLEKGLPDMFSFGIGSGCLISGYLTELDDNSLIRNDLIKYGMLNSKVYAYPYILSGYCLISDQSLIYQVKIENLNQIFINKTNKKPALIFAKETYLNFCEVLNKNGVEDQNSQNVKRIGSTYDAYCDFVYNKSVSLLGTARDLARCKNREEKGLLSECLYTFLGGYSDLVQYVGVVNNSQKKVEVAKKFANFLTLSQTQKELTNYGLFSAGKDNIYDSSYLKDFEDVLKENLSSVNVFSSFEDICNKQTESYKKIFSN